MAAKWIQIKADLCGKLDWQDADSLGQLIAIVRGESYRAGYLEALYHNPGITEAENRSKALTSYMYWLKELESQNSTETED